MRLLIMGPPGAGKGTQAKLVAEHYGIPAISTGDIFRAMKTADTPLARQVRDIMNSGGYVSDEITNKVVATRLADADCEHGFLLDGYPRTLAQVEELDGMIKFTGHALDAVVCLTADDDVLVSRLLQRAQLEGSRGEAQKLIADARAAGEKMRADLLEQTHLQQAELLERARRDIDAERDRAIADLRREAVDLALAGASKVIERNLDDAGNRRLVEQFLSTITANGARR